MNKLFLGLTKLSSITDDRSLKFCLYLISIASKPKLTMSFRSDDILKFSVLGFRSDIRIELQAPVNGSQQTKGEL